jgi:hypothetical protein
LPHSRRLVFVAEVWSMFHNGSPPECSLGWRALDRKPRGPRGFAARRVNSRVRTFPKIKCIIAKQIDARA